jgi:hypothetical protein
MVKRKIRELRKKYLVTFLKKQPPPGDPPPIGDPKPNDPKPNDPPPIRDPPIPPSNAEVTSEEGSASFELRGSHSKVNWRRIRDAMPDQNSLQWQPGLRMTTEYLLLMFSYASCLISRLSFVRLCLRKYFPEVTQRAPK